MLARSWDKCGPVPPPSTSATPSTAWAKACTEPCSQQPQRSACFPGSQPVTLFLCPSWAPTSAAPLGQVYWSNACQIIPPHDAGIAAAIEAHLQLWELPPEVLGQVGLGRRWAVMRLVRMLLGTKLLSLAVHGLHTSSHTVASTQLALLHPVYQLGLHPPPTGPLLAPPGQRPSPASPLTIL